MLQILSLLTLFSVAAQPAEYKCGEKKSVKRSYGTVQLTVDCSYLDDPTYDNIAVLEHKGKAHHGIEIHYDSLWRRRDSSFWVNGKENGTSLYWDTLGNVIGKSTFKMDKRFGKSESYWSKGHPSAFQNYDAQGNEDGLQQFWWENGNKKNEYISKHGDIISATEYFQDGKPRIRYTSKRDPKTGSALKRRFIDCEAWSPTGKSTGKIVKGNGSWIVFNDGQDTTLTKVLRETYKDSLLIKLDSLDRAEIAAWLKP